MMDVLSRISVAEIALLANIIFILPGFALLLRQLMKYEKLYGDLPSSKKTKKKKAEEPAPAPATPAEPAKKVNTGIFPFESKPFMSPADAACLGALAGALGDVNVFPKVALWELIQVKKDKNEDTEGQQERLYGKMLDFLVCDRTTCKPMTAVLFNPGKGRPAGPVEELKSICKAAEVNLVFIDQKEEYDVAALKQELGIPDLDV